MPSDPNNEGPRKNKIDPVVDPNPSSGDYRPIPKPFPSLTPIPNDPPKSGFKSIEDKKRREQIPLIDRGGSQKIY